MQQNRQLKDFLSKQDSHYKILINKLGEKKEKLKKNSAATCTCDSKAK